MKPPSETPAAATLLVLIRTPGSFETYDRHACHSEAASFIYSFMRVCVRVQLGVTGHPICAQAAVCHAAPCVTMPQPA